MGVTTYLRKSGMILQGPGVYEKSFPQLLAVSCCFRRASSFARCALAASSRFFASCDLGRRSASEEAIFCEHHPPPPQKKKNNVRWKLKGPFEKTISGGVSRVCFGVCFAQFLTTHPKFTGIFFRGTVLPKSKNLTYRGYICFTYPPGH